MDVDSKSIFKQTALHYAATTDSADLIQLLISAGANVHAKNSDNRTPLIIAIMFQKTKAVKSKK